MDAPFRFQELKIGFQFPLWKVQKNEKIGLFYEADYYEVLSTT